METRTIVFIIVILIFGGYFAIRYVSLKKSVKDTREQLEEIKRELGENRMLHVSWPNKDIEELQMEMNRVLEAIREEKLAYQKREKLFKRQIEGVSHDLRTPLTAIIGYLKLLDKNEMSDETKENIEIVERKAATLQNLITQFYDFSRITTDDYVLDIQSIDIVRAVKERIIDEYAELTKKNIEVEINEVNGPIWVYADSQALDRVISNLMQNVQRYAVGVFKLEWVVNEKTVEVKFINDVERISEETVIRMFEPFFVGNEARTKGSTGLGMSVAKELMIRMQGDMYASKVNEDICISMVMKLV